MKVKDGYVTNSSSTNFLILSDKELTPELLFKKLGFTKLGPLAAEGKMLASEMLESANSFTEYDPEANKLKDYIHKEFGEQSTRIFDEKVSMGWHVYVGRTQSDSGDLICYFTMDSTMFTSRSFYVDARQCLW